MRLSNNCPICSKKLQILMTHKWAEGPKLNFYRCGHLFSTSSRQRMSLTPDDFTSLDGTMTAYDYQKEFLEFYLNQSNSDSVLNSDQMGLGKTPQALLALRRLRKESGGLTTLIIVPGSTVWQWLNQYKTWCDISLLGAFVIEGTKNYIPPGFRTYIVSMDTFSRLVKTETNPYGRVINQSINPHLLALGIRALIVDECHKYKDTASKRARALVGICQALPLEHKIFLSGTPVMNKADEYFTVLNILDPNTFSSVERFRREYLIQDQKGQWTKVHPRRISQFRETIAPYVIRREVSEVKKDLPPFRRTFSWMTIDDGNIIKQYNTELKNLEAIVGSSSATWREVNESLMALRRLTGIGKLQFATDYIETFMDSGGMAELGIQPDPGSNKIAIGVHHHAVRDGLYLLLKERFEGKEIQVLKLSGEDNAQAKYNIVQEFRNLPAAVLIISSLAGGTGTDGLQICNNILNLERQWNSVNEEQFEARFWRDGQKLPVQCDYLMARGTIDEWLFTELVERKRQIFNSTVSNDWSLSGDDELLKSTIKRILGGRL